MTCVPTLPPSLPLPVAKPSHTSLALLPRAVVAIVPLAATPTHLSLHFASNSIAIATHTRKPGFAQEEITSLSVPVWSHQSAVTFYSLTSLSEVTRYDEIEPEESITCLHTAMLNQNSYV
jgi:hypothetical protein